MERLFALPNAGTFSGLRLDYKSKADQILLAALFKKFTFTSSSNIAKPRFTNHGL